MYHLCMRIGWQHGTVCGLVIAKGFDGWGLECLLVLLNSVTGPDLPMSSHHPIQLVLYTGPPQRRCPASFDLMANHHGLAMPATSASRLCLAQ